MPFLFNSERGHGYLWQKAQPLPIVKQADVRYSQTLDHSSQNLIEKGWAPCPGPSVESIETIIRGKILADKDFQTGSNLTTSVHVH